MYGRYSIIQSLAKRTYHLRNNWCNHKYLSLTTPISRLFSSNNNNSNFIKTDCGLYIEKNLPFTFNKILIANRGEIACRIIRTCKQIGVKTVAIYSDIDINSMFVKMADESYNVGPAQSNQSYLNMDKIIEIAKLSNAEAIHPGYGFLSENADFVRLCNDNNIEFIGPPVDAMENMGLKSKAKSIMHNANVPITPGYHDTSNQSLEKFKIEAAKIGYPIMLKAIAGGGGKGIRPVFKEDDLEREYTACKNESESFFKNDNLLIEKYIPSARHIEFQIFTDKHGNGIHLFERDCSVQRGNQKIFEESPAPGLTPELRDKMGNSAVNAAIAANYAGAGTVEFLVDPITMDYFFMEMNTRLQVEHPVTEMIVGRDLVQWQLHIAAGYELPAKQDDIELNGHAIEARIYAEGYDTKQERFTASSGTLHHLKYPEPNINGINNIRVETGVFEGSEVSTFYDAMIAKLITHINGDSINNYDNIRNESLNLMNKSLQQFEVAGLDTNIEFLKRVLNHNEFRKGGVTTDFIPTYKDDLFNINDNIINKNEINKAKIFASLGYLLYFNQNMNNNLITFQPNSNIYGSNGYNNVQLYDENDPDICFDINIRRDINNYYIVNIDNNEYIINNIQLNSCNNNLLIKLNNEYISCNINFYNNILSLFYNGNKYNYIHTQNINLLHQPEFGKVEGGIGILPEVDLNSPIIAHKSPMQSQVHQILVKEGDIVQKGELLITVTSMKMIYEVYSECNGIITDVLVSNGQSVDKNEVLIKVTREITDDNTNQQTEMKEN